MASDRTSLSEATSEPIDISFSRVQAYARCPWLYNLVYNEGWRAAPSAPAALGQSLHKTLAAYFEIPAEERNLDRLLEIFDGLWVNEGFKNTQEALEYYEKGRGMMELFFAADHERKSKIVFVEKEFVLDLNGINFRGTIDRLDLAPDGTYEIVEYKSNEAQWPAERCAQDLQMTLYQIGITQALGLQPLRLKYYFLSSGKTVPSVRSEEQIKYANELLTTTANAIKSGNFEPNHAYCARCEFGRRCAKYKEPQN